MSIHLICGPMFAGKTSHLLTVLKQRETKNVVLVKHFEDNRFPSNSKVISHDGFSYPCITVRNLQEVQKKDSCFNDCSTIAIDEGQFFSEIFEYAELWACHGKEVIITTLTSGIFMEPLKYVSKLLAVCDKITMLKASCSSCFGKAVFTFRITAFPEHETPESPSFFVGGLDDYTPLCRRCFLKRIQYDHSNSLGMFSGGGVEKLTMPDGILTRSCSLIGNT